jgi:hypothetical protein
MSDSKWDDYSIVNALNYYKTRSNALEYELVLYKASVEKKIHEYEDNIKVLKQHIEKLQESIPSKKNKKKEL